MLLAISFRHHSDLLAAGGHLADAGFEAHFLERLPRIGHDGPRQVRIRARQDTVQRLNENDLAAKGGIDRSQLHADVATPDHQQVLRDVLQLECLRGGHHTRVTQVEITRQGRLGSDCYDRVIVLDKSLALLGLHAQRARIFEVATSLNDLHATQLRQLHNPTGQSGQDRLFPASQLGQVQLRLPENDASLHRFAR